MPSCSVKWCGKASNTSSFDKDGITFHRFPKNPERKSEWIAATRRGDDWFPKFWSVICSRHFSEDYFLPMNNRRRLMNSAVPTLYLPVLAPNATEAKAPAEIKTEPDPLEITALDVSLNQKSVSGTPLQDKNIPPPAENQNGLSKTISRKVPLPLCPSAYNTPTEKRLCRRVRELLTILAIKNKKIKKLSDSNRRLKKHFTTLKSLWAEAKEKKLVK